MTPEQRLEALGLTLPAMPVPVANYVPFRWAGNLLYLSGQGPKRADGTYRVGRLGRDITIEEAYQEARLTGLNLLAATKSAVGDLSRVEAVVKLLGMVNAEPDPHETRLANVDEVREDRGEVPIAAGGHDLVRHIHEGNRPRQVGSNVQGLIH